ncbi:MAG: CHAT domain-containing protein [Bacteroidetes bacterium]|jgi:CHAT domain-containing protein|nr:CHAT domain-containing protein [Bacteroidota bacterium]
MNGRMLLCVLFLLLAAALWAQPSAYCLLQEGDAYRLTEDYPTARERYLAALPHYKQEGDAYWLAHLYLWLSETSYYAGEYDRGLREAHQARRIAQTRLELDTLGMYCTILQNLGVLYSAKKDYDKQRSYYQQAYEAALQTHGWYSTQVADAYASLGTAYGRRNNWTNCILYLDTSLHIANRLNYRGGLSSGLLNISYAYAKKGDLTRAIRTQKQALAIPASKEVYARGLNNLGTLYMDVKDYPQAMKYLKQALAIRREMQGAGRSDSYSTRLNIIHAQFEQGHRDTALAGLEALMAEMNELEEPPAYLRKIALNYKARMLLRSGKQQAALTAINEAVAVECPYMAVNSSSFYVKSQVLYLTGRYVPALRAVEKGLAALLLHAKDSLDWRQLGSVEHGRGLLVLKGVVLREQAKAQDKPALLHQSMASFAVADSLVTHSRLSFASRASKERMMADAKPLYDEALNTLYELYRREPLTRYVAQAFRYMEKNKALSVLENLNEIHARAFHDIPAELVEQELELREDIDYLRTRLVYAADSLAVQGIEGQLNELRQEQQQLLRIIEKRYPRYYQTRLQLDVADLDTVRQELLYDGESMIEYYVSGDQLYAVLARRDSVFFAKLDAPELGEACIEYRKALIKQSDTSTTLGHQLYKRLLAPLRQRIKGDKLLVIPDEALHYIPFDPLVVDSSGEQPYYLLEEFSVRRQLSASTALQLRSFRGRPAAAGSILALAPDFRQGKSTTREGTSLSPLPGAQLELDSLAQSFDGYYLRGAAATEAAVKRCKGHQGVLHLATHTEIENSLPTASRLLLKGGQQQDGYLHAYELYRIALSMQLAFLSACNTGYGTIKAGEGSVSLAHAFAYAGCPNLVMTLWPVRDRTTPTLVSAYYRYLQAGYDKAEAMRQAKRFYLKFEPLNQHPYYWSGFTYLGDRSPIELLPARDRGAHRGLAWAGLALLLFMVITAFGLTHPGRS